MPTSEEYVVVLVKFSQDGDVYSLEGAQDGAIRLVQVRHYLHQREGRSKQGEMAHSRQGQP